VSAGGRPPTHGRYAKDAQRYTVYLAPHEAELVRLAAEGLGESPVAYITRVALEQARKDLT
jgi:hypothetical protein